MDKSGDLALGYSVSSSTMFPAIRFTGRFPTDPLGTLEAEDTIIAGGGSQSGCFFCNRWGDYTSMAIDPTDDVTFVYTNEYYPTTSAGNWSTRIASFKLVPPQLVLNWYDLLTSGFTIDDVHVSNPATTSADATITVNGSTQTVTIPAAGDAFVNFQGVKGGPVFISGDGTVPLVASQRVTYYQSFSEVNAVPPNSASTKLLLNWYDQQTSGFSQDNVHLANPNSTSTTATVQLGVSTNTVTVPADGTAVVTFPRQKGGPVFITAPSPILASRRTIYYSSFNEVNAVPAGVASTKLVLNWYDQQTSGFSQDNVHLANPNSTSTTATVQLGVSTNTVTVPANGTAVVNFPGQKGGPVFITAPSPILASRRTFYYSSFDEVNAVPASAAATALILNWYDQLDAGYSADNIHLANPNSAATTATVKLAVSTHTVTVPANGTAVVSFAGQKGGPVLITSGSAILASRRTIFSSSFHEVNAVPTP